MNFAVAIREIRNQNYLSQVSFAEELGVSFSTVNRWETGKAMPNYKTMKKIVSFCRDKGIDCQEIEIYWKERRNGIYAH